jgi:hypothetical protein
MGLVSCFPAFPIRYLDYNRLVGTIPPAVWKLSSLFYLCVCCTLGGHRFLNAFNPNFIEPCRKIDYLGRYLHLTGHCGSCRTCASLAGMDTVFSTLTSLARHALFLSHLHTNQLTGTLPTSMFQLSSLDLLCAPVPRLHVHPHRLLFFSLGIFTTTNWMGLYHQSSGF